MDKQRPTPVWDLPTRLFHWLAVGLFAAAWWSEKHDAMDWHGRVGLALLAVVLFRLGWGLAGGSTARFAHFLRGPAAVIAYLRGRLPARAGHNPLGGYSVAALLGLLALQLATGLLAVDTDGLESGPLSHFVSFETGRAAARLHGLGFDALLVLIALHLLAIGWYRLGKRRNLILPMITGADGDLPPEAEPMAPAPAHRAWALAIVVAAITVWIARGAPLP